VPPAPGAFSALGVVASDLKRDYSRILYADVAALDPARVAAVPAEMEASASEMLEAAGIKPTSGPSCTHRTSLGGSIRGCQDHRGLHASRLGESGFEPLVPLATEMLIELAKRD
jgi:hypothetical protein